MRYGLGIAFGPFPTFVLFSAVIIFVALLAGFGPGLFATLLSTSSVAYFFWAPLNLFGTSRSPDIIGLVLFSGIGLVISGLAELYRRRETRLREFERDEERRESEGRYRDLVDHSQDLVCTHDLDGNLISVNPAPARLLGYDVGEMLKIPMREMVAPEYRETFDEYLTRIKVTGADRGLMVVLTRTGERRTWEYNNTLRTEGVASPIVRGMAHDVTDRRRAELALSSSERRYRDLFEKNVAGVAIADLNGQVLECNDAWARILGYDSAEEFSGRLTKEVYFNLADREALMEQLNQEGAVVGREMRFRRKDGTPVWVLFNTNLFPGPGGKQMVQSTVIDISQRKEAEEALRRNEERFRVALKDSPITVFNQDRELRYTWIYNSQLYWQHEAIGRTDEEIIEGNQAKGLIELKRRVLKTGVAARQEVALRLDGKRYALDITIEPLFDEHGGIIGITGASMDIARLREMTDRLQDATDRLAQEKSYLESEIQSELGFERIMGQSFALREILKQARVVAPTDSTVLLLGETGTGKELVARSVHALSSRRNKTFIKLNCAAVPSGLLESELFGHEKGAFTGAVGRKIGRIELADKGTLFLDEIGELPVELQPKLLRVLQDREFERLGGIHTLNVDVRIISATNRDLHHDIANRRFREDLFYRLNVFPMELPPLRARCSDIPILVNHFVRKHAGRMGKYIETIPPETIAVLQKWNWPGNVRELENMIERMVIMTKGPVLAAPPAELDVCQEPTDENLTQMEREHIIRVLRETHGVMSGRDGAARRLGIKRTTLQSMLKRFRIGPRDYRHGSGAVGPN
jgi:PAS domain S-box-containing protein